MRATGFACLLLLISAPLLVSAVDPFNPTTGLVGDICTDGNCGFAAIPLLVNRLISFIFYISLPIAAVSFAYAGFLFLTAGPNASQAQKAKGIFMNVAVGFVIVLSAYLIVYTVTSALIEKDFLKDFNPLS